MLLIVVAARFTKMISYFVVSSPEFVSVWPIFHSVYKIILPATVNSMYELDRGDNSE